MNKLVPIFWRTIMLVALLFIFMPAHSQLRKVGLHTIKVELSGPKKIAEGKTATYIIEFQVKRVKENGVDPAIQDITTGVSLMDYDDWFRDGDDLLSHKYFTVPRGQNGTIYSGRTTLQLKCTSGGEIKGIGTVPYGNRNSGEGTAEVYAEFNGKKTKVIEVSCK